MMPDKHDPDVDEWLRDGAVDDGVEPPAKIVQFDAKKTPQLLKATYLPDVHRLLPQSPEAEQGVLSSMLLSPREVGGLCVEKGVTEDTFHIPAHAQIYSVLIAQWHEGKSIDFITLTQLLRNGDMLDQCGGAAFITSLFTFLPTAANAGYYIDIIKEKFRLREGIKICTEHAAKSYDGVDDIEEFFDGLESKVMGLRCQKGSQIEGPKKAVLQAIDDIQAAYARNGAIGGLATGFDDLDRILDGLNPEYYVIAARPSSGKTALMMNIIEHISLVNRKPVALFSLEMSKNQLMKRAVMSRARVDWMRVRECSLSERDFPALQKSASEWSQAPLYIDDSSGLSIQELRGRARRMKEQHDIKAVFIDYLQLLRSATKRGEKDRQQEVAEISGGLKGLCKELEIPIVVLAQPKREVDARAQGGNFRPRMSDLKESGAIENDADVIAFLFREEMYLDNEEERFAKARVAELFIEKSRNTATGLVPLTFFKEYCLFENRAPEPSDSPPASNGELFKPHPKSNQRK